MKISLNWLHEWVKPDVTAAELAEQLTMAGLEIDAVEELGKYLGGVVVGQITSAAPHPDADKLQVCNVEYGGETAQIVCGAPNARVGLKAPLATIGAELPPADGGKPFKIKKAKLRGVESQGMLCAQDELGLGDDHDGLWELPETAVVGQPLTEFLGLPDTVLEVDLTPNRSDCLSVSGVAREVGVISRLAVTEPLISPVPPVCDDKFPVTLAAGDDCPRYLGRVINNVDLSATTPIWMTERLQRAGMRSIDAAVDVTNYVMLELGQPMHAFDLDTLSGQITVRLAQEGERLTLLDESEITLDERSLLITDDSKPLALAGIMGGLGSGVKAGTRRLMLEAAHFTPEKIAGRARHFGMHTESSHRFERGVDPELPRKAMERATQLLLDIVGGEPGPITEAVQPDKLRPRAEIVLRRAQIKRLLGFELSDDQVEDILGRLGISLTATAEGWLATAPTARFDLQIEADLLEELARIYGYNALPTSHLTHAGGLVPSAESNVAIATLRRQLCALEYQEAITYSFIDPALHQQFYADQTAVPLRNPISSEMSWMRTSLLPGLVQALAYNVNRQHSRVRLFETGQCFIQSGDQLEQVQKIGAVVCGTSMMERWSHPKTPVDFYDVKGDVETLFGLSARDGQVGFAVAEHSAMHPGQCASIRLNDVLIGYVGALHPRLTSVLELPDTVFMFELELQPILEGTLPSYQKISKFPEVRRDLAMLIEQSLNVSQVASVVRETAGPNLTDLIVFDVYAGKGIPEGQKSLGLGLTLQDHSRTLSEEDISSCLSRIVAKLEKEFGASLRN